MVNKDLTPTDGKLLYDEESFKIRRAVYEVYRVMGCGFLEAVYQECLNNEFNREGIPCQPQAPVELVYKGEKLAQTYKVDFICFDKIIVEIKAVKDIGDEHRAQVINYLKASGFRLGLLVNFGHFPKATIDRIIV